jgi:hypothetical protein
MRAKFTQSFKIQAVEKALLRPNRWSGDIRNWDWIDKVYLNPEKCKSVAEECKAA